MDANEIRASINNAINLAERVQAAELAYRQAIEQFHSACLLMDLESNSNKSASIMRKVTAIGRELPTDSEITGQVKTELQEWLPNV